MHDVSPPAVAAFALAFDFVAPTPIGLALECAQLGAQGVLPQLRTELVSLDSHHGDGTASFVRGAKQHRRQDCVCPGPELEPRIADVWALIERRRTKGGF